MAKRDAYRFPRQRDPRAASSLFDSYDGSSRPASKSPARTGGYGYGGYSNAGSAGLNGGSEDVNGAGGPGGFRGATPNSKCVPFCYSILVGGKGACGTVLMTTGANIPMLCFRHLSRRMIRR